MKRWWFLLNRECISGFLTALYQNTWRKIEEIVGWGILEKDCKQFREDRNKLEVPWSLWDQGPAEIGSNQVTIRCSDVKIVKVYLIELFYYVYVFLTLGLCEQWRVYNQTLNILQAKKRPEAIIRSTVTFSPPLWCHLFPVLFTLWVGWREICG